MKKPQHLLVAFLLFTAMLFLTQTSHAALVEYSVEVLGSNQYQYNYTITNESNSDYNINELFIYFTYADFDWSDLDANGTPDNIAVVSCPPGWEPIIITPVVMDTGVVDQGYVDILAPWDSSQDTYAGLAPRESLTGLSVRFIWKGEGTPGSQYFEVIDPDTYGPLNSGDTTPAATVPIPATALLLGSGILGLIGLRRKAHK